ncbi:MAG: leucyl aminopeptidase [Myxococcales bacterium]|jgi:leucyl aminopeptidase
MAKLSLLAGDIAKQRCDLLLLPVFESDIKDAKNPLKALVAVDQALGGLLTATAKEEDFTGKAEQSLTLHTHDKIPAHRVLLVGLGTRQKFDPEVLRLAIGRGAKVAQRLKAERLAVAITETRELEASVKAAVEGLALGLYKFDRYKTKERDAKRFEVKEARFFLADGVAKSRELQRAFDVGVLVAEATNWARDLVNEPANALSPSDLAVAARKVGRGGKLKVEVLGRERIEKLRMGMFLAVAKGSAEAPVLVHLSYVPTGKAAKAPALALVGKAITFDAGGLSLKPTDSMMGMKGDMAGAAAVLGAMRVIAQLKPPFPVHAFIGACENMPDGKSYKIGDVLTSRSGKTVEVVNTDAEGRLVLGDVLTWANEHKPGTIIDVATLTGAVVVALGHYIAGVFGSDDAAVWELLEAARSAGEESWRLPLSDLQRDNLKSEIADMKNSGDRWGSSITASLFLKEFVGETPWVHLDIAGTSMSPKERGYLSKGATGAGLRTLVELVRERMRTEQAAG